MEDEMFLPLYSTQLFGSLFFFYCFLFVWAQEKKTTNLVPWPCRVLTWVRSFRNLNLTAWLSLPSFASCSRLNTFDCIFFVRMRKSESSRFEPRAAAPSQLDWPVVSRSDFSYWRQGGTPLVYLQEPPWWWCTIERFHSQASPFQ